MTPVSVIVPIYNGQDDVKDLVQCLCQQTYPKEQVCYILVDNNSRDQTWPYLQALAAQANTDGYQFFPIQALAIQSSYAARNAGVKQATSPILAFTDVDCRPTSQWLEQLMQPFTDPAIGFVIGAVQALPGSSLLEQYAARKKILSHENSLKHPYYPFGKTANLAVRYTVFEAIGLFRPYLTTGGDADLCWRIQSETQWQYAVAHDAIVQHRHRHDWQEFKRQWQRYGRSHRYLNELFGVTLAPELKSYQYLYRASRWLLKELPLSAVQYLQGKATSVDLVSPLIQLLTLHYQALGQRGATLPETARYIESLE